MASLVDGNGGRSTRGKATRNPIPEARVRCEPVHQEPSGFAIASFDDAQFGSTREPDAPAGNVLISHGAVRG